ncbi:overexpressed in colon carcinoma 1 protein isoform X2 [Stegostoma tigrinum]|uniref:overexpressed in colon carcinoma 1 protein isoform X2 n=1 Tax=Stegostoma tigrinum TaxID=3053191 RepID=UPI00202B095F|nr:overexpressed in colon carcinoma 1 protein isoform X2 [Stegostoma tigrinum]
MAGPSRRRSCALVIGLLRCRGDEGRAWSAVELVWAAATQQRLPPKAEALLEQQKIRQRSQRQKMRKGGITEVSTLVCLQILPPRFPVSQLQLAKKLTCRPRDLN